MIYLDHHAAAPLCSAAAAAMRLAQERSWANPASAHCAGRAARALLEQAREQVAASVRGAPAEVVFTSGGTEACNLGLLGLSPNPAHMHVVTSEVEHPAVARVVSALERRGARVTRLSVPGGRAPEPQQLADLIAGGVSMVAMQWVNHETGTLLPIEAYAEVCAAANVPLFVDGTQALGKLTVDLTAVPVTAMAMAAHKLGGPAGVGALFIRRSAPLSSLLLGGGQERGRRAGTPGVLEAVGFGAACEVLPTRLATMPALAELRTRWEASLGADVRAGPAAPACAPLDHRPQINGAEGLRVATASNLSFAGCVGPELVAALDLEGICCASGAACSSGVSEPSPVITAMYRDAPARAKSAIRFSFGPEALDIQVEDVCKVVRDVLAREA